MKENITKHIIIRVMLYIILFFVAIPFSYLFIDTSYRCATGDVLVIAFWEMIFYAIWAIFLLIEAYVLHRKTQKRKRNANIIMALALPTFLLLASLFFWIKDLIK